MRLSPTITPEEIESLLKNQSELIYGHERTGDLSGMISMLAGAMAQLAGRELDVRDSAPDTSGHPDGSWQ